MPASRKPKATNAVKSVLWDLLTFDRMLTGPVTHLIYWAGLALICLGGFTIIGGAIGLGIRDGSIAGVAVAFATLIAGFLVLVALVLLWRGVSEFYLAVFRIAEDLRAIRIAAETGATVHIQAEPIPFTEPAAETLAEPPVAPIVDGGTVLKRR